MLGGEIINLSVSAILCGCTSCYQCGVSCADMQSRTVASAFMKRLLDCRYCLDCNSGRTTIYL